MPNNKDDEKKKALNAAIQAGFNFKAKTDKNEQTSQSKKHGSPQSSEDSFEESLRRKFKNTMGPEDSDDEDDSDFDDMFERDSSSSFSTDAGSKSPKSTGSVSPTSSTGVNISKSLQNAVPVSKQSFSDDSDDEIADAAFGLERSKTPIKTPVKTPEPVKIAPGKVKDRFADAVNTLGAFTSRREPKPSVSTGKVKDKFADAVNTLTDFTKRTAKSTEQMVASAMQISKETDKGLAENTQKLEQLVQITSEQTHATSKNVQALDAFIVKHMATLKHAPTETKAALNVATISTEAVDFAKAEIKAGLLSIERDEAVAAVDIVKKKALALELELANKARGINKNIQGKNVNNLDFKIRNSWLQAYKDEIKAKQAEAALIQQKVNHVSKEAEQARAVEIERIARFLREGGIDARMALENATARVDARR
jgi:hypothetical protein